MLQGKQGKLVFSAIGLQLLAMHAKTEWLIFHLFPLIHLTSSALALTQLESFSSWGLYACAMQGVSIKLAIG